MSSFIKQLKNPNTKKKQKALCIDDFYGTHRYGYFFRKDGKDATFKDFDKLQQTEDNFDIFDEYELDIRINQTSSSQKELPMGVSQWLAYGKKYGYYQYFVGQVLEEVKQIIIKSL